MTQFCDRCKKEMYRFNKCDYCKKTICFSCVKSSQKNTKTSRLCICKDCWSDMKKRKEFKTKKVIVEE